MTEARLSPDADHGRPLRGRTIAITADRRWKEQAGLFERRGATVVHAPTMRTVDLRSDDRLRGATERLCATPPDVMVATTGQGMKWWLETAEGWGLREDLLGALRGAEIIARGAKAASAVKGAGLDVSWRAPQETMAEISEHVRDRPVRPARMAVQLYDPDDEGGAITDLSACADHVELVPVYRWDLPADLSPVLDMIDWVVARTVHAVTFTSQPAVRNLVRIAHDHGRDGQLRAALADDVVPVCVGPVCAEAGVACGLASMRWPEVTRLPAMVRLATELLS